MRSGIEVGCKDREKQGVMGGKRHSVPQAPGQKPSHRRWQSQGCPREVCFPKTPQARVLQAAGELSPLRAFILTLSAFLSSHNTPRNHLSSTLPFNSGNFSLSPSSIEMRVIYNKIHPSEAPSGQGFVVALLCESQGSCPSFHCPERLP